MTTPAWPHQPAPAPGTPRRYRRPLFAGAVVAFALVLAAAIGWWLTVGAGNPTLEGRPRVTDGRAGISYGIPEGWKRTKGDMIDAFTSGISRRQRGVEGGGVVSAGRGGPVPPSALRREAEKAARSNSEFFFPDRAPSTVRSEPTTVDRHRAHTVVLTTEDDEGRPGRLTFTLVARVRGGDCAFLEGVRQGTGARDEDDDVDAVVRSATVP